MTLKREAKDRKRINILETEERGMSLAPREKRRRVGRVEGSRIGGKGAARTQCDRVAGGEATLDCHRDMSTPSDRPRRRGVGVFDGEALDSQGSSRPKGRWMRGRPGSQVTGGLGWAYNIDWRDRRRKEVVTCWFDQAQRTALFTSVVRPPGSAPEMVSSFVPPR